MDSENIHNEIDQYLNNELTDVEMATFEKKIRRNPNLKKEVNDLRLLRLGIRESTLQDKVKMLKQYDAEEFVSNNENTSQGSNVRTLLFSKILGVAASLIVLVGAFWVWNTLESGNTSGDIYAEYFEPYPSDVVVSRSASSQETLIQNAHGAYQNENYKTAAPLFEKLYEQDRDTMSLFYAGISYLGYKDYENAKRILNQDMHWQVEESYLKKIRKIIE